MTECKVLVRPEGTVEVSIDMDFPRGYIELSAGPEPSSPVGPCARCYDPGRCCRHFGLGGGEFGQGLEEDELQPLLEEHELPFEPAVLLDNGVWRFSCPRLTDCGRCSAYEARPFACSDYEPLSDDLCVHHGGAEAGDPTVPLDVFVGRE